MRDMSFIPLGIVIIIDALLISMVIMLKVRGFFVARKANKKEDRVAHPIKRNPTFYNPVAGRFRGKNQGKQYEELDDESDYFHGSINAESNMIPMSTSPNRFDRQLRRQPTGFQAMGVAEMNFSLAEHMNEDNNGADRTDLQRFVQSLSKIMGASTFGLSFEFQNLRFHPKKSPRPILQDVSGLIHAGSLWGVMGASGAGKCKFLFCGFDVLSANCVSYIRQCAHGQAVWDHRDYQSQWYCW